MARVFRLIAVLVVAAAVLLPAAGMAATVSQTIQGLRQEYIDARHRYNEALAQQKHYEDEMDKVHERLRNLNRRDLEWLDQTHSKEESAEHIRASQAEFNTIAGQWAADKIAAFEQKNAAERVRQQLNERIIAYMTAVWFQARANTWASQGQATRRNRSNVRRTHRHPGGLSRSQAEFLGNAIRFLQGMPTIRSGSRPPGRSRPPGHSHSHGGRRN